MYPPSYTIISTSVNYVRNIIKGTFLDVFKVVKRIRREGKSRLMGKQQTAHGLNLKRVHFSQDY